MHFYVKFSTAKTSRFGYQIYLAQKSLDPVSFTLGANLLKRRNSFSSHSFKSLDEIVIFDFYIQSLHSV